MIVKVSKTAGVHGELLVSGSKNASLPALCASLLTKEWLTLENVPLIDDIDKMLKILKSIGCEYTLENHTVRIRSANPSYKVLTEEVGDIRASYYLMGALLSRKKKVLIGYPGGCNLGSRPIDFHLKAFRDLGFRVTENGQFLHIVYEGTKKHRLRFAKETVGGTINALLASCRLEGTTLIENASLEPEVLDIIELLNKMGAKIERKPGRVLSVAGVAKLKGTTHKILFDRMEAGSYMLLASSLPNSNLTVYPVEESLLRTVISVIRSTKTKVKVTGDAINIKSAENLKPVNVLIGPYPFFPTDLQQILSVMLLRAEGESLIEDTVFPGRISHIGELKKLGGRIEFDGSQNRIVIHQSRLKGSRIKAHDLRCAFGLLVAGGMADNSTIVENVENVLRGYENPLQKLKSIGFLIEEI